MLSHLSRRVVLTVGILAAITASGVGTARRLKWDETAHNFYAVKPGVLYRSGNLYPADMERLIRRYGLRTVVNLREDVKFASLGLSEKTWVEERGLRYVYLPSPPKITPCMVRRFLEVATDPENQPVLVHCHQGRGRTGVLVAAYRIAVERWSVEEAVDDMVRHECSPKIYRPCMDLLRGLEDSDWRNKWRG